ncbi:hypothetical protein AVEN_24841-1 [Araneus ventricosus]|uniref:Uncharacterized protein n=1 Tax=Araneus ventricosus TaxID=182803 RepID=A0A4Y2BV65_ARAVE|nr:hypothetical protein AVEN_24841-1 [Araneus ventricosus]
MIPVQYRRLSKFSNCPYINFDERFSFTVLADISCSEKITSGNRQYRTDGATSGSEGRTRMPKNRNCRKVQDDQTNNDDKFGWGIISFARRRRIGDLCGSNGPRRKCLLFPFIKERSSFCSCMWINVFCVGTLPNNN